MKWSIIHLQRNIFFHKRLVGVTCCLDVIKMPIKIIVKYMHTFFPGGNVHKMHVKCTCVRSILLFPSSCMVSFSRVIITNCLTQFLPEKCFLWEYFYCTSRFYASFLHQNYLPCQSVDNAMYVYSKSTQFLQQEMCNLTCDCATTLFVSHQTQYFLWGKRKRRRLKK